MGTKCVSYFADDEALALVEQAVKGKVVFSKSELELEDCLCGLSGKQIEAALAKLVHNKRLTKRSNGTYSVNMAVPAERMQAPPENQAAAAPEGAHLCFLLHLLAYLLVFACCYA